MLGEARKFAEREGSTLKVDAAREGEGYTWPLATLRNKKG
jgi:hypothetical protein